VIVSQRSSPRRVVAEQLGATVVVDPTTEDLGEVVREQTGGRGVDLAIICIGVPVLINQALRLTRVGGQVNIFAGPGRQGMGGDRGQPDPLQPARGDRLL
jgi:L-iditol 2-dehydrogenase